MIPRAITDALRDWRDHGTHPDDLGSFLRAVLTNDLRGVIAHAEPEELSALAELVRWIYWNVPSGAYGTTIALLAYHDFKRSQRERGAA